jgi:hypothetical protein
MPELACDARGDKDGGKGRRQGSGGGFEAMGEDLVGETVFDSGAGGEDAIPVGVEAELFSGLTSVPGKDLLGLGPEPDDLVRLEDEVGDGALTAG